ncbi:Reverse transcriptase zinc-binding domain [Sesbania bispinosa]|nr:Reverse transcriptase zinc-binding domain [Sesbania bispinosa]
MKLGWGLITHSDAFLDRVLRAKYACGGDLVPSVKKQINASNIWRGIVHTWPHVLKGLRWIVGNGKKVSFWQNNWLPCGELLSQISCEPIPLSDPHLNVSHFVIDGHWNVELFRHLLPAHVVNEIINHPVPSEELGEDHPSWSFTPDGSFDAKSAYMLLTDNLDLPNNQVWDFVWRWEGPQSVHCFLWSFIQVGLKTNLRRVNHSMGSDPTCPPCHSHVETESHILRDCSLVQQVWKGLPNVMCGGPTRSWTWNGDWRRWISDYFALQLMGCNTLFFMPLRGLSG